MYKVENIVRECVSDALYFHRDLNCGEKFVKKVVL